MARKQSEGAAARAAVYERGLGRCDRCGGNLGSEDAGWHAHHRLMRSQGGTWQLANIVALCAHCHRDVHGGPERAYAQGWLVRGSDDPARVPVMLRSWIGGPMLVLLDDDGSFRVAP